MAIRQRIEWRDNIRRVPFGVDDFFNRSPESTNPGTVAEVHPSFNKRDMGSKGLHCSTQNAVGAMIRVKTALDLAVLMRQVKERSDCESSSDSKENSGS